jgi:hypothetical protein
MGVLCLLTWCVAFSDLTASLNTTRPFFGVTKSLIYHNAWNELHKMYFLELIIGIAAQDDDVGR